MEGHETVYSILYPEPAWLVQYLVLKKGSHYIPLAKLKRKNENNMKMNRGDPYFFTFRSCISVNLGQSVCAVTEQY